MFPVSVVVDGVGLNMTVMSYRDHLDFGIVTGQGQIATRGRSSSTCTRRWTTS